MKSGLFIPLLDLNPKFALADREEQAYAYIRVAQLLAAATDSSGEFSGNKEDQWI